MSKGISIMITLFFFGLDRLHPPNVGDAVVMVLRAGATLFRVITIVVAVVLSFVSVVAAGASARVGGGVSRLLLDCGGMTATVVRFVGSFADAVASVLFG